MPDMYECEVKRPFKVDGKTERRWVVRPVADLPSGSSPDIRCKHCQGRVKVHKQQVPDGPADHVEHISRDDANHCPGSVYFQGDARPSQTPVL